MILYSSHNRDVNIVTTTKSIDCKVSFCDFIEHHLVKESLYGVCITSALCIHLASCTTQLLYCINTKGTAVQS